MRIRNLKNTDEIIKKCKYLVNNPKQNKGNWNKIFKNNNPINIEIGMGKGNFIIDMAKNNPSINFIGIELYTNVLARAAKKLENIELNNLFLININASELNEIFEKEIDTIYLNFSDPWPKKRNAKRRLTSTYFLDIYDNLFKNKKHIYQKTDNQSLFESSIISLSTYGYKIEDISLDLWNTDKTYSMTEYEEKFKNLGVKILYLEATKD